MKLVYLNIEGHIPYDGVYLIWSDYFDLYYKKHFNTGIAVIYEEIEEYRKLVFKKFIL